MSQPNNPPSNPLLGAIYIDQSTNLSWVWTGTYWIQAGGSTGYNANVGPGTTIVPGYYSDPRPEDWFPFVGSTPPLAPKAGQIWVDTSQVPYASYVWDSNLGQFIVLGGGPGADTNSIVSTATPNKRVNNGDLEAGDLWINPTSNRASYWNGSGWAPLSSPDTNSILSSNKPLFRVDGTILQAGDLWLDLDNNAIQYYNGVDFFPVTAVSESIQIGATKPTQRPSSDPLVVGDLWTNTTDKASYYYDGSDYVAHQDLNSIEDVIAPLTRLTGGPLEGGDQWYNPTTQVLKVYDSTISDWVEIGNDTHSFAQSGDPFVTTPVTDRIGGVPTEGDQYFDTAAKKLYGYTGGTWYLLSPTDTHSEFGAGDPNTLAPYNAGQRGDNTTALTGDQFVDTLTDVLYYWDGVSTWREVGPDTHSFVGNVHPSLAGSQVDAGNRPNGSLLADGDQYTDTTTDTLYYWFGGVWNAVSDTHAFIGTVDPSSPGSNVDTGTKPDGITVLKNGDTYFNTVTNTQFYYDSSVPGWVQITKTIDTHSFAGAFLPTEAGSLVSTGFRPDGVTALVDGDQYVDTRTNILYVRSSGSWEAVKDNHAFIGAVDPSLAGSNVDTGTRPDGITVLENGDTYFNTVTNTQFYYDSSVPGWVQVDKTIDTHSFAGAFLPTEAGSLVSTGFRPDGVTALVDGDQYVDTRTKIVYVRISGSWEPVEDKHAFVGTVDPSLPGSNVDTGTRPDGITALKDGDTYFNTVTQSQFYYDSGVPGWVALVKTIDTHSLVASGDPNTVSQTAGTTYYDVRPDGSLLTLGDQYIDSATNVLYYWDGAKADGSKWTVVSEDLHSFTSAGDPNLNTYSGLTHPTTGIAFKNGDHYVDTQTNLLYSRDGVIWDVISPDFHCFAQAGNPNTTVSQAPGNTYYDIREDSTPLVRGDQYIDTNTNLLYFWDWAKPDGSKWTVVSEDTHAFTGTVDPNVAGSNVDSGLRPDGFSPLKDGDIYFNTSTNTQFYYNLGTTSWVSLASAVDTHSFAVSGDPNAVSQTAGTTYYDLRPDGTSLLLGDLYVDTSTNLVYYWDGTKANGSKWTLVSSDTHSYIDAGDPNGNTYNGVAHPTTTVPFKDGDQYLDNVTKILYSRVGVAWVAVSGDTQSFVGSGTPYILTPAPGTLPKSLRDDGSALISGDQYIDTGSGILYYYNGSDWEQASDLHSYNGTVDPALAGSPVQTTRPDGSALRVGDQYTNTTTETLWYWNTSWIKFDIERDTHSLIGAGTPYISVPVIGSNQQTTRDGVSEPLRSGDQYIDTNTGIVYYYTVGQDWLPFSDYTQSFTGAGTPFIAAPAVGGAQKTNRDSFNTNLVVGDQFVDTGTNILYYYNGSEWEQIQDIHSYNGTVDPALVGSPVQTTRPDGTSLVTGDQYTNTTTGELWYWDSTGPSWFKYAGGSDTQGIIAAGEPYLTGGTPKSTRDDGSALQKGDQYVDTNTGIAYYFTGNPGGDWVVFSGTNTYVLTDAGYPFIATPFPAGATAKSTRDGTGALVKGDLFINESTDGLFWYDGAEWKPTLDTHSILLGSNAPTLATTRTGGLDVRNGDIVYATPYKKLWIWDGSAWNPAADQHSFAGGGGPDADIGTGPNRPDTSPLNTGDQYFNLLTGDLSAFGFNASTWILPNTETGRIAQSGTPVANTVTLRGNGTALKAGDLYVDTSSGVVYIHNGTTTAPIENGWSEISRDSDVQLGTVSPPVVITRSDGTDRKTGDLYINTVTGEVYYYDGANWQLKPSYGDTHSFTNTVHPTAVGSLVNAGNRPDGTPLLTGDRYFNSTSKELFVWDGSAWILTGPIEHRSLSAAPTLRGNGIDSILEGDLWTSSTSSRTFVWDGTAWIPQNSFTFVQTTTPSASLTYTGDLWIDTNINRTFYWDGAAWVPQGSYNFVQDAQPAVAYERDVWIDTTDMTMYVYYNDGVTTAWTQIV